MTTITIRRRTRTRASLRRLTGESRLAAPQSGTSRRAVARPTRTVYWSPARARWPESAGPAHGPRPEQRVPGHCATRIATEHPPGPPSVPNTLSPDPVELYPDLWVSWTPGGRSRDRTRARPGRGRRPAAAAAISTSRVMVRPGAGCPSCPGRRSRRCGAALVVLQSIWLFGAGLFHRLRPVVALERRIVAPSAIGDGHPWPE